MPSRGAGAGVVRGQRVLAQGPAVRLIGEAGRASSSPVQSEGGGHCAHGGSWTDSSAQRASALVRGAACEGLQDEGVSARLGATRRPYLCGGAAPGPAQARALSSQPVVLLLKADILQVASDRRFWRRLSGVRSDEKCKITMSENREVFSEYLTLTS